MKKKNAGKAIAGVLAAALLAQTAFVTGAVTQATESIQSLRAKTVHASDAKIANATLANTLFATKDQLMNAFDTDAATEDKAALKVNFGVSDGESQEWYVVGQDTGITKDNVVLFATRPLATDVMFQDSREDQEYDGETVHANHYGASDLRSTLNSMTDSSSAYFSSGEVSKMSKTTVNTWDTYEADGEARGTYATTDYLYALTSATDANISSTPDSYGSDYETIYAGSDASLKVDDTYWGTHYFWMRSPAEKDYHAQIVLPGIFTTRRNVDNADTVQPAFALDLSSVVFASDALAASSETVADGKLERGTALTLRYDAGTALGSVNSSEDKTEVVVSDLPADKTVYLVVQNSAGNYVVDASALTDGTLAAADVTIAGQALADFNDCYVWLESTDADRITTAAVVDAKSTPVEMPYVDVTEADPNFSWFGEEILSMYEKGIMTGIDPTHFAPYANVIRADLATILYRIEGEPVVDFTDKFPDIQDGIYYSDPVIWASGEGVVKGYSDGKFHPIDKITRQDMVVMLYRYAGEPSTEATGELSVFTDADDIYTYAEDALKWGVAKGLLKGNADGTLKPQANITRAEIAVILDRFVG